MLDFMQNTRYSCQDFNETEFSCQIFEKYSTIKFHENPSSDSRVVAWDWTDMTKVAVAFRNFPNAPRYDTDPR